MMHSHGANASTAGMVWPQILQGADGFSSVAMQVGAQASVTHLDVAMVTKIGGAIRPAAGTKAPLEVDFCILSIVSIRFRMPENLVRNHPRLSSDQPLVERSDNAPIKQSVGVGSMGGWRQQESERYPLLSPMPLRHRSGLSYERVSSSEWIDESAHLPPVS